MSRHQEFYKNELRKYPFFFLLLPLAAGIWLQSSLLPFLNASYWASAFMLFAASCIIAHCKASVSQRVVLLRFICINLVIFSFGACLSFFNDIRNSRNWFGHFLPGAQQLQLEIDETPVEKERTIYVPCRVVATCVNSQWRETDGKIKLYFFKNAVQKRFAVGNKLVVDASHCTEIKNAGNPFGFDYAAYAGRQGWYHQIFCGEDDILSQPGERRNSPWLEDIRNSALGRLEANVTDSTTRSLIAAMMLNERSDLDDTLWQAYATTGIIHIISISGMHVAMLFNLLLGFLVWIRDKRYRWLKYFIAIPMVWLYISLAGFPASAVRAGAMFTLLAVGIRLNRDTNSINILLATAFLLLVYNPAWLYDTGFQLSFAAVLSILIFYIPVRSWYRPKNTVLKKVWESLAVCIAAQLLTFPLGIYYFHQFPLWVLLAALPAAPFSVILMVGSCLLIVLGSFTSCIWLGNFLSWITSYFHLIIRFLAVHTPQVFRELYLDAADYWLLTAMLTFAALSWLRRKKWLLVPALLIFCVSCIDRVFRINTVSNAERFVVYNISGRSFYDHFNGRSVVHFYGEHRPTEKDYQYVYLPPRLAWFSSREEERQTQPMQQWKIMDRDIVTLKSKDLTSSAIPCDYLVLNRNCVFDPETWEKVFSPEIIILDGSIPRWRAKKWIELLKHYSVKVHWVQESGAWVFPSR